VIAQRRQLLHFADDRSHMPDGFDDIARTSFAFGTNHGRAFRYAPHRFAQIASPTNKRNTVVMLPDVVLFVRRRQHFALVNEVHFQRLQHLSFGKVPDAPLGHHWNRDGIHDFTNDLDGRHPRHAALFANVRRHPLESHHRAGTRLFRDLGLFGVRDVHNHAALEHFRQADLHAPFVRGVSGVRAAVAVSAPVYFFRIHILLLEPEKSQSRTPGGNHGLPNYHEPPAPARQQIPVSIVNLADAKPASSLLVLLPAAHNDLRIGRHRLAVFDTQLRGDGTFFRQFGNLAHHFIQQHGDHAAVDEARSARIARPENKFPTRSPRIPIDLERQLHPRTVGAAATKTIVRRIRCQNQFFSHFHPNSGFCWVSKSSLSFTRIYLSPRQSP